MGKPTICIGENKDADQLRNREADQRLCFRYSYSTISLFYLNPKFPAPISFPCPYRSVCVGPVRKPHCWFFQEVAQILCGYFSNIVWSINEYNKQRLQDSMQTSFAFVTMPLMYAIKLLSSFIKSICYFM